jgi:hypothetical protein
VKLFTIIALALAIGLATAASPFASTSPDGLNRVADDHAFSDTGKTQAGLIGFTGTVLVFALGFGLVKIARRRPVPA